MFAFIKSMYDSGKITKEKAWSYVPKFLTAAEAKKIAGPKPQ